jgi:hypothetical protein
LLHKRCSPLAYLFLFYDEAIHTQAKSGDVEHLSYALEESDIRPSGYLTIQSNATLEYLPAKSVFNDPVEMF